jgi:hypothetical protein
MDEQDFDRLFGSQLPNFAGSDWREMEGRLERRDLKRKLTRLLWALPSIAGVMLAVSAVLYHRLDQTQQKVKELESRLVKIYSQQPDTILQKTIVYDTIYQRVFVPRQLVEISTDKKYLSNNTNNIYYAKYDNKSTGEVSLIEREKYVGIHSLKAKSPTFEASTIESLDTIQAYKAMAFEEDSMVTESHFSLMPKSVTVGLLGGIQMPIGNEYEHGGGSQIGLRTILGYHNSKGQERWGVVLDFQKNNLFFENNKEEAWKKFAGGGMLGNSGLKPPKKVDIPMYSAYQVGIGLRYNLLFSDKIIPYFGVSWNVQMPNHYNINYYFDDPLNTQSESGQKESISNLFGANVGANYQFSKHLSASAEMYFQGQILKNPNPLDSPAILGGRFGIHYRFGN